MKPESPPAPPALALRAMSTNRPTISRVGPKPSSRLATSERPVDSGSALIWTRLAASCVDSAASSANVGTSVEKRVARLPRSLPVVMRTGARNVPWIVEPFEEISFTSPARTWSRKNGA